MTDIFILSTALKLMPMLCVAGFVSGLSGFAFAAVASVSLWLLPPLTAIPLVMLLSVCNQLFSAGSLFSEMKFNSIYVQGGPVFYIAGGLVGVPIGIYLLKTLPATSFAAVLGAFLVLYAAFSLIKANRFQISTGLHKSLSGWKPAALVGALGGVVGGFSAFPGSVPVVYLGLLGKTKVETRSIVQPYILVLQIVALCILATTQPEVFKGNFWALALMSLPAVLLGTWAGVRVYRRLSDINFRRAVLVLLMVSGTSLVAKSVVAAGV